MKLHVVTQSNILCLSRLDKTFKNSKKIKNKTCLAIRICGNKLRRVILLQTITIIAAVFKAYKYVKTENSIFNSSGK